MADNSIFINYDEGLKRMMNNAKFYVKMLTKFKDENNLNDIEGALTAGDMAKAQVATHTMKGLAGNLSLTELYKQSLELETQIKGGSVNPDQLGTLKNVFAQTLTEVEKVIAQNG